MKVRFYAADKRLTKYDWPGGLLPVEVMVKHLQALTPGLKGTEAADLNGVTVIGRVRDLTDDYAHVVFYRIRADQFPLRYQSQGDIGNLDLDEEDGLAEPTEMLFFRSGLVGHLVNRDGPGAIACARYLDEKTNNEVDAVLVALLYENLEDRMRADDEVSQVKIRVSVSSWEQLGHFGEGFRSTGRAAAQSDGTGSVEMIFRPERGKKERFWDTWRPRVLNVVQKADPGEIDGIAIQRKDEELAQLEMVNLLLDRIAVPRQVNVEGASRHISADEARNAILAAYAEERQVINNALARVIASNN